MARKWELAQENSELKGKVASLKKEVASLKSRADKADLQLDIIDQAQTQDRTLRVEVSDSVFKVFPGDTVYAVDKGGDLHLYGKRGLAEYNVPNSWYSFTTTTHVEKYPYYHDPRGHFPKGEWKSVRYINKEEK